MNILVLGKPKTGTTVISKTICHSLHGETSYVFEPNDEKAFQQQPQTPHCVVKVLYDHWMTRVEQLGGMVGNGLPLQFDKRVIVRRDPRDECISVLLYYPHELKRVVQDSGRFTAWLDVLRQKERDPASLPFLRMCEIFDELFDVNFTKSLSCFATLDAGYSRFWQQLRAPFYGLKYEDFMAGETRALAGYLKCTLSDRRDVGDRFKHTYRTGSFNNWKRYFTPQDIAFFGKYRDHFKMLGYEDWELTPVERIPEQELSGYVRMLLSR